MGGRRSPGASSGSSGAGSATTADLFASLAGDAPSASDPPKAMLYARVALPVPLGQTFTYLLPEGLGLDRGWRVLVELGRRKELGVIVGLGTEPPPGVPEHKLKPILAPV